MRSLLAAKTREPQGKGWMTTAEFCKTLTLAQGTALRYLRHGIALGKLERFSGTAQYGNVIRIQTWYRPVQVKRK
jgi:hypothetical protein